LIFSLMFFHVLITSSISFKFSKAAKLFEMLLCCCFPTSSSLSFLRLNYNILFTDLNEIFCWHQNLIENILEVKCLAMYAPNFIKNSLCLLII
jgi:hypothetical protein